jgi:hypothetical protein
MMRVIALETAIRLKANSYLRILIPPIFGAGTIQKEIDSTTAINFSSHIDTKRL